MIDSSEKTLNQYFHECEKKSSYLFREFIWILTEKLKLSEADLISGVQLLDKKAQQLLDEWTLKKKEDYPLQYFIGSTEFCGLNFYVEPGVLIPRNETEEIAHWVLGAVRAKEIKSVLDIGTGSGCLGIGVVKNLQSVEKLVLVEPYAAAAKVLTKNIKRHFKDEDTQVEFFQKTFEDCEFQEGFDLILSNPPYIAYKDPDVAQGVYQHEPYEALFSGELGWEKEVHWARKAYKLLNSGGVMAFEFSHDQKNILQDKLQDLNPEFHRDCFGKDRFMTFIKDRLNG